jgi:hypothetical protein
MNRVFTFFAQDGKIDPADIGIDPVTDADTFASDFFGMVYFAAGIVCVVVIIAAGILYTTSGGDASKITKAKNALLYAIIGLVVILFAFVITQFILGRFT